MTRLFYLIICLCLLSGAANARMLRGGGSNVVPISNWNGIDTAATPLVYSQVATYDDQRNGINGTDGSILQCHDPRYPSGAWSNCPDGTFYLYTDGWDTRYMIWAGAAPTWGGFRAYTTTNFANQQYHYIGKAVPAGSYSSPAVCQPFANDSTVISPDCQRPQVIYNAANDNYVMWFETFQSTNVGVAIGLKVITCPTPGFYAVNSGAGCIAQSDPTFTIPSGVLNQPVDDFALMVRKNGNAFIAVIDSFKVSPGAQMRVWALNSSYTNSSGTGSNVISNFREGVSLFENQDSGYTYIIVGGTSGCGYCNGKPSVYYYTPSTDSLTTATWTGPNNLSTTYSCGSQPFETSVITAGGAAQYLWAPLRYRVASTTLGDEAFGYGNQGGSNMFMMPLSFSGASINTPVCNASGAAGKVYLQGLPPGAPPALPAGTIEQDMTINGLAVNYNNFAGVTNVNLYGQVFTATSNGTRSKAWMISGVNCLGPSPPPNTLGPGLTACFDGGTSITVNLAACSGSPCSPGTILASSTISGASLLSTPTLTEFSFSSPPTLTAGTQYVLYMAASAAPTGAYFFAYDDTNTYGSANGYAISSSDGGSSWAKSLSVCCSTERSLMFALAP